MIKWHKITEKLPPINTVMFILDKNKLEIKAAKLLIFRSNMPGINNSEKDPLKEEDIFWDNKSDKNWYRVTERPYCLTNKELVQLVIEKTEEAEKKANRLEILDL